MVCAVLAARNAGKVGSAKQISSTLRSQTLVRGESLLRLALEGVLTARTRSSRSGTATSTRESSPSDAPGSHQV
jgi:hypothetical protein